MRILVLAVKPPRLSSGDALRFVNIARPLRERHAFELFCYAKEGQALDAESAAVFERVTQLPYPVDAPRSAPSRVLSALSASHFMPSDAALRNAVGEALARRSFDLVFDLGGLMLDNLPPGERRIPVVVDSIDEPAITYGRALRHAPWRDKPRLLRTKLLYERINARIAERASVNVYASDVDAAHYARVHPSSRVETIPNGVDAEHFRPRDVARDPGLIAFEGNFAYAPNVDAARILCREILPLVRRARPIARVVLVGRDPLPEVRELASPHVAVTGTVDDVREHLWAASAFACPLRLGAGIKNKVLQAWALGVPIVATPESLSGLEARDGENVLVAEGTQRFAERLVELLASSELQKKLATNGRELVLARYTWKLQAERFEKLFADVAFRNPG